MLMTFYEKKQWKGIFQQKEHSAKPDKGQRCAPPGISMQFTGTQLAQNVAKIQVCSFVLLSGDCLEPGEGLYDFRNYFQFLSSINTIKYGNSTLT